MCRRRIVVADAAVVAAADADAAAVAAAATAAATGAGDGLAVAGESVASVAACRPLDLKVIF